MRIDDILYVLFINENNCQCTIYFLSTFALINFVVHF